MTISRSNWSQQLQLAVDDPHLDELLEWFFALPRPVQKLVAMATGIIIAAGKVDDLASLRDTIDAAMAKYPLQK